MPRINVPILLLSIVLSIFLWVVRFGQDLSTSGAVPIKLKTSDVTSLLPSLSVIDIKGFKLQFSGPAEAVARAENDADNEGAITVDLSTATKAGTSLYPLHFPSWMAKLNPTPSRAQVELEDIVTKVVPIAVDLKGKLSDPNSRLDSHPTSENSATIKAPRHIADSITAARAVLNLSEISPDNPRPQDVGLVPVDNKGVTYDASIDPLRVTITPIVMAAQIQKSVVVSPVITGTPATGYIPLGAKLTPKEIQVTGPTSTLLNMFSIKTEPIDITGLAATKWFVVRPLLPAGTSSTTKVIHVRYDIDQDPAVKRAKASPPATSLVAPTTGAAP
jgi:YbbR domain-containing protein